MSNSASGARIQGDDYQHLFAWYQALRLLDPSQKVTAVEVEAENAGHFDDVVVRRSEGADEYYQVKYSVDASHPIDGAWWLDRGTASTSPLEKFWKSWQLLHRSGASPTLCLVTNRALDTTHPLLKLRDGRNATLMPRAREASAGSDAGRELARWATHLKVQRAALEDMLERLSIRTELGQHSVLADAVADRMRAEQLRHDEGSVSAGVQFIRDCVATGTRSVDADRVRKEIDRRALRAAHKIATLVIEGIDERKGQDLEAPTVTLRWIERFEGERPESRRRLRDPADWNGRLLCDLVQARETIEEKGFTRVHVRAWMRLTPWFALGNVLCDTRGYVVTLEQKHQTWSTDVPLGQCAVTVHQESLGDGDELALVLSATHDILGEVRSYLAREVPAVGRLLHVRVAPNPSREALPDASLAKAWADNVYKAMQTENESRAIPRLHLFQAGPAGAALMLGHIWNRAPATLLYEDTNPSYTPAIELTR